MYAFPRGRSGGPSKFCTPVFESDLETALEKEAEGQTFCGRTEDHEEGVMAFFEKREANFSGR